MSTWLTKELTLDLLAITIDGLNKIFNRINQDQPAVTTVPAVDPATAHPADLPPATPEPAQETPAPQVGVGGPVAPESAAEAPAPAEPATEPVDAAALLVEAQTALRTIAQKGDVEWITGTLFPHFGVQSLTEIPAERLPELITMAAERNAA